jgi:hypothetical protein
MTIISRPYMPDTILFVGFSKSETGDKLAKEFYDGFKAQFPIFTINEIYFPEFEHWYYNQCYEVELKNETELREISALVSQYGDLAEIPVAEDEAMVILCTRETLIERYDLIRGV